MTRRGRSIVWGILLGLTLGGADAPRAQTFTPPPGADAKLSGRDVRGLVESLGEVMETAYLDSVRGAAVRRHLRERLRAGAYRGIVEPRPLVTRLLADVQSVIDDDHFNLLYFPPAAAGFHWANQEEGPQDSIAALADARGRLRGTNFGVARAEVLDGNLGWLTITRFEAPPALLREPLAAAFTLLANTDALIVDLRRNPGGLVESVQLAFSYFLDGPSILASSEVTRRTGKRVDHRTTADPGGPKYLGRPVYVLTGPATGSGAEMFAYQMKHYGKGTLVGRGTSGAAHAFNTYQIAGKGGGHFMVLVPDSRTIDARTGGDWEKVGVPPDVEAGHDEAPGVARRLALEALLAKAPTDEARAALRARLERMAYEAKSPPATVGQLEKYVGRYGIRRVFLEDGTLHFQRDNGPPAPMAAVADDTFELDIAMTPKPRVRFEVEGGVARAMVLHSMNGEERVPRDP